MENCLSNNIINNAIESWLSASVQLAKVCLTQCPRKKKPNGQQQKINNREIVTFFWLVHCRQKTYYVVESIEFVSFSGQGLILVVSTWLSTGNSSSLILHLVSDTKYTVQMVNIKSSQAEV